MKYQTLLHAQSQLIDRPYIQSPPPTPPKKYVYYSRFGEFNCLSWHTFGCKNCSDMIQFCELHQNSWVLKTSWGRQVFFSWWLSFAMWYSTCRFVSKLMSNQNNVTWNTGVDVCILLLCLTQTLMPEDRSLIFTSFHTVNLLPCSWMFWVLYFYFLSRYIDSTGTSVCWLCGGTE